MPPTERSTFSLQKMLMRVVFPFVVGGAVGYALAQFMYTGPGSDRPPIIVSDGSIEIEEAPNADGSSTPSGKGTLKDVSAPTDPRKTWQHDHSAGAPRRLSVLVQGADSAQVGNCPVMYFAQDITAATITYTVTGGTRDVIVTKQPGSKPVDISVRADATVTQPSPSALTIDDGIGAKLASVAVAWGNGSSATSVTCKFGGALPPRLVFLQGK